MERQNVVVHAPTAKHMKKSGKLKTNLQSFLTDPDPPVGIGAERKLARYH